MRTFLRASRPALVVAAALPLVASHSVPNAVAVEGGRSSVATSVEPNQGQFEAGVAYGMRAGGMRVAFGETEVTLPGGKTFSFHGADDHAPFQAIEPLPGLVHYFPAADPESWITDVPTFQAVRRTGVYPGVDAVIRPSAHGLELELVLAPGADPSAVVLDFGRAGTFRLDAEGQAVLGTGADAIRIGRPVVEGGPLGVLIPAGGTVALRVQEPVARIRIALDYPADPAGGAPPPEDALPRVAVDAGGEVFVAGSIVPAAAATGVRRGESRDRKARGPRDLQVAPTPAERTQTFVTRVSGATILETAWLGLGIERPRALATAPGGDLLIAGAAAGRGGTDAFAIRLARSGLRPLHEARIGGHGQDRASAMAVDAGGAVWIAGTTDSPDLAVSADAAQPQPGGRTDAFVARLDASLQVTWLSYLGEEGADEAIALTLDGSGAIHVAGTTESDEGETDVFLVTLDAAAGTQRPVLAPSGSENDSAVALAVERTGDLLLLSRRAGEGTFLARITADGGAVKLAVRLDLPATTLALDRSGRIWIGGTSSTAVSGEDAFVARLAPDTFLARETHLLTGDRGDFAGGLAMDPRGDAVLAGLTRSDELAAVTRVEGTPAGDTFLARVVPDEAAPQGACPGTKQWTGGPSGNWETEGNWSGGTLPTATDDVCIQNAAVTVGSGSQNAGTLRVEGAGASLTVSFGTLTIAGASEIDAPFTFSGGTLTGAGNIAISGLFTWGNGTMSGTGTTTASGGMASSTPFGKTLTRTLVLPAGQSWVLSGSGGIAINTPGILSNLGTFEHQADGSISGTGTFNNAGTFLRTISSGTALVSCVLNNTGTVDVQTGELSLQDNGTHTGSFDSTGALLRFSGGTQTLSAVASVTGGAVEVTNGTITVHGSYDVAGSTAMTFGTLTFSSTAAVTSVGALAISNGTLTFNSGDTIEPSTLNLGNGTLTGSDSIDVSGLFTWGGGTMSGTGTTTASGGIAFPTAFGKTLTRTLIHPGSETAVFSGTGSLVINTPGVLDNAGIFEHQSDASISGTGTFNNSGTFQRTTSAGNALVSCVFNNTGSVDVQSGELSLQDNGAHTGSFDATGALLRFSGGTQTLSAATTVTGTAVEFTNGNITLGGSYDVTGTTGMTFGTATFSPTSTVTSVGALAISNGTLTFNSGETIAPTTLSFSNGTLTGSDSLTVAGLFTWGGGTMSGSGSTTAGGGIAFTTAFGKTLTRTLVNPATEAAIYTGTGGLVVNSTGVLSNAGTFEHQSDATISGTGTFNSSGTFLRTTSAGNAIVSCVFNNTGSLDVQTGELSLQDNGAHTGSFDSTGALLRFSGGTQTLSAATAVTGTAVEVTNGTITVSGTYDVAGSTAMTFGNLTFAPTSTVTSVGALAVSNGTMTFNSGETIAPTTLTFSNGTLTGSDAITVAGLFTWGGGAMSGSGTTTANGGIAFTTAFGKTLTRGLVLPATKSAVFTGTGGLVINNPGTFENSGTFDHQTDASISGTGTFNSPGTLLRTTSAGNAIVSCPLNNTGSLDVQTGELSLQDNGAHTGSFDSTGALLRFSGGTQTLSAATAVTGTAVEVTNGTITVSGTYDVAGSTAMTFGNLTFAPTSTVTSVGALAVSNGTMTFNSGETIAPTTLTFSNGTLSGSDDITVVGLLTWGGGTMSGTGTTTANGGIAFTTAFGKTLTRTLVNPEGETALYTGAGGLVINSPGTLSNAGTFEVQTDISLAGTGSFANSGAFQRTTSAGTLFVSVPFDNGGTVDGQSGTLHFQGSGSHTGAFVAGPGAILQFAGGTHTFSGTSSFSAPRVEWTGGTSTFAGTYTVASTLISFGTLNIDSAVTMGTLDFTNGTLSGTGDIVVTGLLTWSGGTMSGTGTTAANGGLAMPGLSGRTLSRTLDHGNGQTATLDGTGGLNINTPGVFNNEVGASFVVSSDCSINGSGTFANAGTFRRTTSPGTAFSAANFTNSGTLEVLSGTFHFSGPSYTQTAGSTLLNGGNITNSFPLLLQGGTLGGVGTITGNVNNTGGSVAPGLLAGTLTLVGDYTQGAGAAYTVEIGGLTAGTQHDVLALTNPGFGTGDAALDGDLNVSLVDGFDPTIGNTFTILTADARTGQFSGTNLPAFGCGKTWNIVYNPTSVVLQVVAEAGSADLTVTHTDAPDPVASGDPITYTVTVANGGPDDATLVTVTQVLPAGVSFVSATPSQGTCSETVGTVTCNLGTVADAASASVSIVGTAGVPGNPAATASAASAECDPAPADNTDVSTSTTVLPACPDADDDGYALCTAGAACMPRAGDQCGDCDDTTSARNPGATEICDGLDNDCANGVPADEADADGDDFRICENDCDDGNDTINPGVVEADPLCGDTLDNDCDGDVDLDDPSCLGICPDADNDGFAACSAGCLPDPGDLCGDCDDTDDTVHPGAAELCNGVDDDCAGGVPADETDADGDTFRICAGDCDDTDGTVHPGATEQCNGIDDDCAGGVPANEADADGDTFRICAGDCDDTDDTVHPGATEQCNGIDDDCAGGVPANEADADGDTFRICAGDCDDGNDTVHPGATEQCNGIDDDCAGGVPANETDADGDNFRICENDCDDGNDTINPGVVEADPLCGDTLDNDCDGDVDLDDPSCLGICPDADNDGFAACSAGCLPDPGDPCGDCDDTDDTVHPGAAELCNGVDDDCAGGVPADETDADGDTFRICAGDCDDTNDTVHPGAPELCNGVDDDCAGGVPADETDGDADGSRVCDGDCNDGDPDVKPGVPEQCNGIDDDCDGDTPPNESDSDGDGFRICKGDCDDTNPNVRPDATEICDGLDDNCDGVTPADEADVDMDGYRVCQDDCNDADPDINPGVVEDDPLCADGIDNDCDGDTDLDDQSCLGVCLDADGDGYAVCSASCSPEVGDQCGDCDDTDGAVHPGTTEQCNGIDDDCAGGIPANEADADGDGFRVCQNDCDDTDAGVHPNATEQCNGVDDDCVGGVPANEADADADGFRVCENDCNDASGSVHPGATEQCNGIDDDCSGSVPAGEADADGDGTRVCAGDCNDADAAIEPGAPERCNGLDDDCNGSVPVNEADADGDGVRLCGNDCDDTDPDVNPSESESGSTACGDEIDNDCDGDTDLGDVGCAVAATTCSTLGDQAAGVIDEDVFAISGVTGEAVTVTLTASGTGSGRADLVLMDAMGTEVDFFRIDRSALPNTITVNLPLAGPYIIAVKEHQAGLLLPGSPFTGAYCLTVDAGGGAAQTLLPTSSVESAN